MADVSTKNGLAVPNRHQHERRMLALDALTNLAKKFSRKPDFHDLVDTLVLTLAGQFSVANAFAKLIRPDSIKAPQLFFATGRFMRNRALGALEIHHKHNQYFGQNPEPQEVDKLCRSPEVANLGFVLVECDVRLVVPLLHENRVIGLLGMGEKVTKNPFSSQDLELLAVIVNTITPLIVNSFLFFEIKTMSEWYIQILDSVRQGVFVFDTDLRLNKLNVPAFEVLKRFKPHLRHLRSLKQVPIQLVFPETQFPGWVKLFETTVNDEHGIRYEKMKANLGDSERFYSIQIGGIRDSSGRTSDLIITVDDITEQEENDQRLFDLEKLAEKGMMASSISHELNNYLGLLLGGIELSQLALGKGDTGKTAKTLEKLKESINKMERFTAGLMDYARLSTALQKSDLNAVVSDVLSFITVQKRFRNITIQTDLDRSLPEADIDPDQMAQLLLNLLNNAADAIKESTRHDGRIVVSTIIAGDNIELLVKDNGVGIEPEVKDRLCNVHLTTKPDGHGYGLVTCAKIVQNHHGEITVDSTVGKGSTFTVRIPLTQVPASTAPATL